MKERPMLFSGPMVRAILDGRPHNKISLDERLVARLFNEGHTAKEMADAFGCSVEPVRRVLKSLGLKRPAKPRIGVNAGPRNSQWKGGRRIRSDGYVVIWTVNGERLEHQVVMERHLGRPLVQGEVIHHRDRNKQNNQIWNLELTNQSDHAREHAAEMHSARYGI